MRAFPCWKRDSHPASHHKIPLLAPYAHFASTLGREMIKINMHTAKLSFLSMGLIYSMQQVMESHRYNGLPLPFFSSILTAQPVIICCTNTAPPALFFFVSDFGRRAFWWCGCLDDTGCGEERGLLVPAELLGGRLCPLAAVRPPAPPRRALRMSWIS